MVARRNQGEAPDSYFLWFGFGFRELKPEEMLKMQENTGMFPGARVTGAGGKLGVERWRHLVL